MTPSGARWITAPFAVSVALWSTDAGAPGRPVLPSPLGLRDVIRIAVERGDDIQASRARIRAGEARPTIALALEDPMLSPSLDHLPFMPGGADVSVTIEQRSRFRRFDGIGDGQRWRTSTDCAPRRPAPRSMLASRQPPPS
jgi:hypothetical protein